MATARSGSGSTFSVLGADTAIKGDISASADLHIDGKVEGDIACASLVQGESSEIIGNISAESARFSGTVSGSITARELVILKSARIDGDVSYEALTIEQGAQVNGRLSPKGTPRPETGAADSSDAHLILTGQDEAAG
jgi:cytoskeletal protein CcmA (bactofilin family)